MKAKELKVIHDPNDNTFYLVINEECPIRISKKEAKKMLKLLKN